MTSPRLVLLVGAPRSGTTWLQSLLGSHPAVVTPQETDLFSRYVRPLADSWAWQLRGDAADWRARRFKGLPGVLTKPDFAEIVRHVIDRSVGGMRALVPDASVVVEKSPSHSFCAEIVAEYAPEVRVIHLVRDGRDVAASLLAAADGWGRSWAPGTLRGAAVAWAQHVDGADSYRKLGFVYREVRYESLVDRDVDVLADLFDLCGLDVDDDTCAQTYDRYRLDAMANGSADDPIMIGGEFGAHAGERAEPEGFFGAGPAGSWRTTWTTNDRLLFQAVAGEQLERLGYERDGRWAASLGRALAYTLGTSTCRTITRVTRSVGRTGDQLARKIP